METVPVRMSPAGFKAFMAAFVLVLPYILYQAWAFVAPGLHKHERKYAAPFVIVGSLLFLLHLISKMRPAKAILAGSMS